MTDYITTESGTSYAVGTPAEVIACLERFRVNGARITLYYGNGLTGELWGDVISGTIGRSTGTQKIPLHIARVDSSGGEGILTDCIVKITASRKPYGVHWQHPTLHEKVSDVGG